MGDTEQRILITVAGQGELNALIAKYNEGNITWGETLRLKKLFTEQAKQYVQIGGEETKSTQLFDSGLKSLNGTLAEHNVKVGAAHERYFSLGEQVRENLLQSGLLNNSMGQFVAQATAVEVSAGAVTAGYFAMAAGALAGVYALSKFAEEGAKLELLRSVLDNLTKKEGSSAVKMMNDLRDATAGTIPDIVLMQKAVQFKATGIFDSGKIVEILKLAHELSDILPNMSFEDVAQSFVKAEAGGVNRIARQMGLVLDLKEAEQQYAISIGKTNGNQLSEREKKLADMNELLNKAHDWESKLGVRADESLHSIERLDAAIANLKTSFSSLATIATPLFQDLAMRATFIATLLQIADVWASGGKGGNAASGMSMFSPRGGGGAFKMISPREGVTPPTSEEQQKAADFMLKIDQDIDKSNAALIEGKHKRTIAQLNAEEKAKDDEAKKEITNKTLLEQALDKIHQDFNLKRKKADKDYADEKWQTEFDAGFAFDARMKSRGFTQAEDGTWINQKALDYGRDKRSKAHEKSISVGGKPLSEEEKQQEVFDKYQVLTSFLESSFDQVGQSITSNIHDKLVRSFNGARSVAQQFFLGIADSLMNIGTKAASSAIISGILSFIPGMGSFSGLFGKLFKFGSGGHIGERVIGVGTQTGASYEFGERPGGEDVIPSGVRASNSAAFGGDRSWEPYVSVVPIMDYATMSVKVEVGKRIINSGRRL